MICKNLRKPLRKMRPDAIKKFARHELAIINEILDCACLDISGYDQVTIEQIRALRMFYLAIWQLSFDDAWQVLCGRYGSIIEESERPPPVGMYKYFIDTFDADGERGVGTDAYPQIFR